MSMSAIALTDLPVDERAEETKEITEIRLTYRQKMRATYVSYIAIK